jgi:UDP-glucose 4-epimerase
VRGENFFIIGGAGFLGSHFTDRLLADDKVRRVTLFDNFSSGREWHYAHHGHDSRLQVVRGDVKDFHALKSAMDGHDVVIHLASNPDIARAATEPDIDFREGTFLTQQVVEAMRQTNAKRILYSSGSGIYGDLGEVEAHEDMGPLVPVSTYGASKLAGEALISSYCYMFEMTGCVCRFGNVVGPRQTHGVGFDFLRQLLEHPRKLRILGDGTQSKSYIHAFDVTAAVLLVNNTSQKVFSTQNVATGDYITVTEIATLAIECAGLEPGSVEFEYTGGDRGWKGDVPIVRLNTDRIKSQGWRCSRNSAEALRAAMISMLDDARSGRLYAHRLT